MEGHEVGWDMYISAGDWGATAGVRGSRIARRAFLFRTPG